MVRSLPPTTTGATQPGHGAEHVADVDAGHVLDVGLVQPGLLTVRMPSGMVPVGSKGSTTGGSVLGGSVGSVPRASELVMVRARVGVDVVAEIDLDDADARNRFGLDAGWRPAPG